MGELLRVTDSRRKAGVASFNKLDFWSSHLNGKAWGDPPFTRSERLRGASFGRTDALRLGVLTHITFVVVRRRMLDSDQVRHQTCSRGKYPKSAS
jgi:hypothetical protein